MRIIQGCCISLGKKSISLSRAFAEQPAVIGAAPDYSSFSLAVRGVKKLLTVVPERISEKTEPYDFLDRRNRPASLASVTRLLSFPQSPLFIPLQVD